MSRDRVSLSYCSLVPCVASFQALVTLSFVALPVGALLLSLWLTVWRWPYSLKGSLLGCLERRLSGLVACLFSPFLPRVPRMWCPVLMSQKKKCCLLSVCLSACPVPVHHGQRWLMRWWLSKCFLCKHWDLNVIPLNPCLKIMSGLVAHACNPSWRHGDGQFLGAFWPSAQ